jgi:hypothetical protein
MNDLDFKHTVLDNLSASFCAAKWYNATIWLGSGQTTSCHHPPAHLIDSDKVSINPRLLHNTDQKKEDRRKMINGERPPGCEYCWKIEDMGRDAISDRVYKSRIYPIEALDEARNTPYIKSDLKCTEVDVFGIWYMKLEIHHIPKTSTSVHLRSLLIVLVSLLVVIAIPLLAVLGYAISNGMDHIPNWYPMVGTILLTPMIAHNYMSMEKAIHTLMHFLSGGNRIYIEPCKSSESPVVSPSCQDILGSSLTGLKQIRVRVQHAWLSIAT